MKHTQDKWHGTTDGEANFYGIATIKDWLMRIQQNGELSTEEQEANIKLILAAPKLLGACKTAKQIINAGYRVEKGSIGDFEIEAAIAEAIK